MEDLDFPEDGLPFRYAGFGPLPGGDQSGLAGAIAVEAGLVVVGFRRPLSWVSLYPEQAREVARTLVNAAEAIDGRPFTLDPDGRHR